MVWELDVKPEKILPVKGTVIPPLDHLRVGEDRDILLGSLLIGIKLASI
jgi:hypothetical protein